MSIPEVMRKGLLEYVAQQIYHEGYEWEITDIGAGDNF